MTATATATETAIVIAIESEGVDVNVTETSLGMTTETAIGAMITEGTTEETTVLMVGLRKMVGTGTCQRVI